MEFVGDFQYRRSDIIGHGAFAVVFRGSSRLVSQSVYFDKLLNQLLEPLNILFESSYKLGKLPDEWKLGHVTAVYKNVTQIRSQPGFLKNAHQFLLPQSPILSTFPSSPASFTPLSKNPLSHHCLRNQHWIKKNSRTIGQSRICLSFPK